MFHAELYHARQIMSCMAQDHIINMNLQKHFQNLKRKTVNTYNGRSGLLEPLLFNSIFISKTCSSPQVRTNYPN